MGVPQRKRPVHLPAVERANRSVIQFVTVCTQARQPLLANAQIHGLLLRFWRDDSVYRVGRYVVMPDHLHLFCAPNTYPIEPLSKWVGYWKSRVASLGTYRGAKKLWQKNFWDRQLRGHESYSEKWHYVLNNPVRAGLVDAPEEWPYQGELSPLLWHD
ncbi:MAG: REP-associated tyrosine transposase [Opitutales bacterium]